MSNLEDWLSNIETFVRGLGSRRFIDIITPPDAALSKATALQGFPSVLPLWSGRSQTVGLLAGPSAPAQAWPAVIISGGEAFTLASTTATLLPQLILQRVLSKLPATAERFADGWAAVQAEVLALHHLLGGSDGSLDPVIAAVRDPETRKLFASPRGQEGAFQEAHSRLARQVDTSEQFIRYADWLDTCIQGRCASSEDQQQYGPWARRVMCWMCRLRHWQSSEEPPAGWVYEVIEADAGIDSGVPTRPSWAARPGAASGEAALVEAAQSVSESPPSGDIVTDGLAKALITEGISYKGYAHAEAVAVLDERGEAERAWRALQSAAWWAAHSSGEASAATLKGAALLAARHNWPEIQWMMKRAGVSQ